MSRACTVCTHREREAIDAALAAGEPYRNLVERYGLSLGAIARHKEHLPAHVARARDAEEIASADALLARLEALIGDAQRIGKKAERAHSYQAAIAAIREQARILELLLEVAGELGRASTTNVVLAPQWEELRTIVLGALQPYAEARVAVAEALADG